MQKTWLKKNDNSNCIIYFNGWGMDKNAIEHLNTDGYDLCMFSQFNEIKEVENEFQNYEKTYLVAWSLGVWVAARSLENSGINFEKSMAINGTLSPIDPQKGIQPRVFEMTLEGWNERNRNKFNVRVMGGQEAYFNQANRLPERNVSEQKEELFFLQQDIKSNKMPNFRFSSVVIGRDDMIFLAKNQWNAWSGKAKVTERHLAHYPFAVFQNWADIIAL